MNPAQFFAALVLIIATAATAAADLATLARATCRIQSGNSVGTGTVIFIDQDGAAYVLTNNHVAGRVSNKVTCEFWTADAKRNSTAGRVVKSVITKDYVDIAVVKIEAAEAERLDLAAMPLAEQTDRAAVYHSSGCPGGRWPSVLKCQAIAEPNNAVLKFYPRPGGGRSGSAMVDAHFENVIGLLAWSTDNPGEPHGNDGTTERSGKGLAMPVETVWQVLENQYQATSEAQRPPQETPLTAHLQETETEAGLRRRTLPGEQLSPDRADEAAKRWNMPEQMKQRQRPRLFPSLADLARRAGRLVLFVLAAIGAIALARRFVIRPAVPLAILAAVIISNPQAAQAQTYAEKMQGLADRWNMEQASAKPFQNLDEAKQDSETTRRPIVLILTMDNCAPCEQLKNSLAEACANAQDFNQINLAAINTTHASAEERAAVQAYWPGLRQFPAVVVLQPMTDPANPCQTNWRVLRTNGKTSAASVLEFLKSSQPPTPAPPPAGQ
jgi:hypothetical protein